MNNANQDGVKNLIAAAMHDRAAELSDSPANRSEIHLLQQVANGRCLLPLPRVSHFAQILGIDEAQLLTTALEEYHPGLLEQIQTLLYGAPLSANERKILAGFRAMRIPGDRAVSVIDGSSIAAVITQDA